MLARGTNMAKNELDRRSFLKGAALTTVGMALSAREVLAEVVPGAAAPAITSKKTKTTFRNSAYQTSGIPLGGIGAGSVEIRPDGTFQEWLIFNMGGFSPSQPDHEKGAWPDMGTDALQFYVRTQQGDQPPMLRRLTVNGELSDLYSASYCKCVQAIDYDGKFPFATLDYHDETLPIEITGLAFSPIIPTDSRTSGTPGFTVAFKVKNRSKKAASVSLMGCLKNPLAWGAADRALRTEMMNADGATHVVMRTQATSGRKAMHGTMAFAVTGDQVSHIAGGYHDYLGNGTWDWTHSFGSAHFSFLRSFRDLGRLPSRSSWKSVDHVVVGLSKEDIDKLPKEDKQRRVSELNEDAFFHDYFERIRGIDSTLFDTDEGLAKILFDCQKWLNNLSGDKREKPSWGDVALASQIELKPGEEKEVRFLVGWHFPNHFSQLGPNMGHQYENWFPDALAVTRHLAKNHSDQRKRVVDFAETMLSTNVEEAVAFAWGAQLTTLIKSSWWTKDGRFAIWEGLGCCGLHTTDITYQGSFPLIALYPDLQTQQIDMGAQYQRADGRVHHFFAPDLLHVDNGFDRVDMNPQFVMMICRDYLWTGDLAYVKKLWPKVVKAMDSTQQLDGDGDGIPDRDTRRNTYDQWDLEGSPAYIVSLWLGALQAAIRLAHDLGETARETQWQELLTKAKESFVKRLWNGEYFNLWVSDRAVDNCCMSDQLSGQWYSNLMGLGSAVDRDHVLSALKAVHKHNFTFDGGLLNAGLSKQFKTHQNLQAAANWTGIEYANAAMMIDFGMVNEGIEVMRSVHDRYIRAGRRWNHVECGDHYYRAMSSWATLLALSGFKPDAPRETLTLAPQVDSVVMPWFTPSGYGVLAVKGRRMEIEVRSGSLSFKTLRIKASRTPQVSLGGKTLSFKTQKMDGLLEISFEEKVTLRGRDHLVIG